MRYPTQNERIYLQEIPKREKQSLRYVMIIMMAIVLTVTIGGIWLVAIIPSYERPLAISAIIFLDVIFIFVILSIRAAINKNTPNNRVFRITGEYRTEDSGRRSHGRIISSTNEYSIVGFPEPWWKNYIEDGEMISVELFPLYTLVNINVGEIMSFPHVILRLKDKYAIDKEISIGILDLKYASFFAALSKGFLIHASVLFAVFNDTIISNTDYTLLLIIKMLGLMVLVLYFILGTHNLYNFLFKSFITLVLGGAVLSHSIDQGDIFLVLPYVFAVLGIWLGFKALKAQKHNEEIYKKRKALYQQN
jgi:hypothetical protein